MKRPAPLARRLGSQLFIAIALALSLLTHTVLLVPWSGPEEQPSLKQIAMLPPRAPVRSEPSSINPQELPNTVPVDPPAEADSEPEPPAETRVPPPEEPQTPEAQPAEAPAAANAEVSPAQEANAAVAPSGTRAPAGGDPNGPGDPLIRFEVGRPVPTLLAARDLGIPVVLHAPGSLWRVNLDASWRVERVDPLPGGQSYRLRRLPVRVAGKLLLYGDIAAEAARRAGIEKWTGLALLDDARATARVRASLASFCRVRNLDPDQIATAEAAFARRAGSYEVVVNSVTTRSGRTVE